MSRLSRSVHRMSARVHSGEPVCGQHNEGNTMRAEKSQGDVRVCQWVNGARSRDVQGVVLYLRFVRLLKICETLHR